MQNLISLLPAISLPKVPGRRSSADAPSALRFSEFVWIRLYGGSNCTTESHKWSEVDAGLAYYFRKPSFHNLIDDARWVWWARAGNLINEPNWSSPSAWMADRWWGSGLQRFRFRKDCNEMRRRGLANELGEFGELDEHSDSIRLAAMSVRVVSSERSLGTIHGGWFVDLQWT